MLTLSLIATLAGVVAAALETPVTREPRLALVGVRVLTMSEPPLLEDQTVLVAGERIESIGARERVEIPATARVIEGRGRVLMPGLIDAHIHLRDAQPSALVEYLRAGITTAREMNGRPFLLEWRDRIEAGELVGPTLRVAAPTLGNFSSPRDGYATPETDAEGRAAVARFHADGYDWIKVYSFLGREAFGGVMAEARRLRMPVGGHVPVAVGLEDALVSGMRSIEHLTEYVGSSLTEAARELDERDLRSIFGAGEIDDEALSRAARATVNAGIWNVPTLIWFDHRLPAPVAKEAWADPRLRRQGERNRRRVVGLLNELGAPLAIGTDSDAGTDEPASVIHDELAAMAEAGLGARAALYAATMGGARLLGLEAEVGSVEPGKRADLLILGCDPIESVGCTEKPELVIFRGRVLD